MRAQRGVGQALPGVELRIDEADPGGVGEVVARGPNVMAGYTDAEATSEAIDADGWLHTGDLGRMDSKGRLEIVGRRKDVVVLASGENVYPEDVERRLGAVPHIAELAVVGVDAGASERLACLAVPEGESGDRAVRSEKARAALRRAIDELPFVQRPAFVHLYEAPLPRTATRKIKRDEVRAIVGRLVEAGRPQARGAEAQGGPVRAAIAAVRGWPVERIATSASLVGDLGFDSLMLTELLEALEVRFGAMDTQRLQACETVSDVEQLIENPRPPPAADAPRRDRGSDRAP